MMIADLLPRVRLSNRFFDIFVVENECVGNPIYYHLTRVDGVSSG